MKTARAPRKTEKVRGMNASLSMPTDLSSPTGGSSPDDVPTDSGPATGTHGRVGVIDGPALSERDPGRLHISRRQLALGVVIAALAVVAGIYTVDAATVGDQAFPAVVSSSKVYDLNFANTGTVVAIKVKPGQRVSAGEVLATQDLGALEAQLHADQQVVAADQATVQQASAPQLTTAQNEQNGLQVQQQQTALANAQAALAAATQTGAANITSAQGAVAAAEAVAQGNYTLYTQACPNGPVPPDPGLTGTDLLSAQNLFTHCQQLQSTSEADQAAVAKAQAQVPVTQAQAMQADNSAQATVNAAQAALNLAQYQGTLQRSPADAQTQAQAKAALNQATAQMDKVQAQVQQATIVAPADGIVAQVNGSTGENLGPAGVPAYKAPSSIQSSQPSGFSLFPSQPTPSGSSSSGGNQPLIEIVGGIQQVTAQVPESTISKFRVGQGVTVSLPVLDVTQQGVVTGVVLSPTGNSSAVTYAVIVKLNRTVPGLLPGMTATVRS